jgi:hypothetical protein
MAVSKTFSIIEYMKRIVLSIISLMVASFVTAQSNLDILTISGRNAFSTEFDSIVPGQAKETGGFVGLTVPVPINKKTIVYNSLNYFYFHVDNILDSNSSGSVSLHGFILRTGIVQRFGNGQSIQLLFSPRYMSDMKGGGADNLQLGGLAMYEKKFNNNLTMGFGAMFNKEFFGSYLVPLVNLNWNITEKLSIAGMLPVYAKIKYKVTEKLTAGISHFGLTTSFGLNETPFKDDYIERQSIDLALFGNYNIAKNFYLEGRFGKSMSRCYKQYASDQKVDFAVPLKMFGDSREIKNIRFKDGMFMELRLIYSIQISDENN